MSYYSKNKEYCNAKSIAYYYSHREQILARIATHRERTNAYNRWYYYEVCRNSSIPPMRTHTPKPLPIKPPLIIEPLKEPPLEIIDTIRVSKKKIEPFKDFKVTPQGTFILEW